MITIQVEGQEFTDFESASVMRSVDTLSGSFSFSASPQVGQNYPIRASQECRVFVDGVEQINGFVENVSVSYSGSNHEIKISGRDKTADMIDSTVGKNLDLKGPISLKSMLVTLLSEMKINASVIDNVGNLELFSDSEIVSAKIDDKGFDFAEKFARMRQVFLTGDGRGNIVITRAGSEKAATPIQNVLNGEKNNIKSASASNDISNRFNLYDANSQLNTSATEDHFADVLGSVGNEQIANQTATATDGDIRPSRRLFFTAEESADGSLLLTRAQWESDIRRARSSKFNATVQGFGQENGNLWQPNQLVSVSDDFSGIKSDMLIWSTRFEFSTHNGSLTEISMVPPDALKLLAEEPVEQKKTSVDHFKEDLE